MKSAEAVSFAWNFAGRLGSHRKGSHAARYLPSMGAARKMHLVSGESW
jgi:hypothetical protein